MRRRTAAVLPVLLAISACLAFRISAEEDEKPQPLPSPDGRFVLQVHKKSDDGVDAGKPSCTILERATKKQVWPAKADAQDDIFAVDGALWSPDSKRCAITVRTSPKVVDLLICEWNGKAFVGVSVDTGPLAELVRKSLLADRKTLGFTDKAGEGGRIHDGLSAEKWITATSLVVEASKEISLQEGDNRDIAGGGARALMQWDAAKRAFVFVKEMPEGKK